MYNSNKHLTTQMPQTHTQYASLKSTSRVAQCFTINSFIKMTNSRTSLVAESDCHSKLIFVLLGSFT